MLKTDRYAAPADLPNPRITLEVRHAPETEKELRSRRVCQEVKFLSIFIYKIIPDKLVAE